MNLGSFCSCKCMVGNHPCLGGETRYAPQMQPKMLTSEAAQQVASKSDISIISKRRDPPPGSGIRRERISSCRSGRSDHAADKPTYLILDPIVKRDMVVNAIRVNGDNFP